MSEFGDDRLADEVLLERGVVGDLRSDAAQGLLLLGELRCLTQWDDETLCAQLGCDLKSRTGEGARRREDPATSRHSVEFLELVRDAAQRLDLTGDRREALNMAFALCDRAGGPVGTRVARVRAALEHTARGELRPFDLLDLGEIGRAWRLGALALGSGPAYERAHAAERLVGRVEARGAHISPERLRVLAAPNAEDALGAGVARAMGEHLSTVGCRKCVVLAESLGLGELVRPREFQSTAA